MNNQISETWFKINTYQAVSDYFKHPTDLSQQKLLITLAAYREYYKSRIIFANNAYDEYERMVSE
jgi:ribosomal protein S12 methylthiotransferase accessory factor YcaO